MNRTIVNNEFINTCTERNRNSYTHDKVILSAD